MLKNPIQHVVTTKNLTDFWDLRRIILNTSLYETSMIMILIIVVIKVGGNEIRSSD